MLFFGKLCYTWQILQQQQKKNYFVNNSVQFKFKINENLFHIRISQYYKPITNTRFFFAIPVKSVILFISLSIHLNFFFWCTCFHFTICKTQQKKIEINKLEINYKALIHVFFFSNLLIDFIHRIIYLLVIDIN